MLPDEQRVSLIALFPAEDAGSCVKYAFALVEREQAELPLVSESPSESVS